MAGNSTAPRVVAGIVGLVVAVVVGLVSGRSEAWDSPLYWRLGYPAFLLAAFLIGRRHPEEVWPVALVMMAVQVVPMALGGSSLSLWPLALVMLCVLALPIVLAGKLGARFAG
jgi:hypothetical protein